MCTDANAHANTHTHTFDAQIRTQAAALNLMHERGEDGQEAAQYHVVNPKSVTIGQLYGQVRVHVYVCVCCLCVCVCVCVWCLCVLCVLPTIGCRTPIV
jgi:hypothetical protein